MNECLVPISGSQGFVGPVDIDAGLTIDQGPHSWVGTRKLRCIWDMSNYEDGGLISS